MVGCRHISAERGVELASQSFGAVRGDDRYSGKATSDLGRLVSDDQRAAARYSFEGYHAECLRATKGDIGGEVGLHP